MYFKKIVDPFVALGASPPPCVRLLVDLNVCPPPQLSPSVGKADPLSLNPPDRIQCLFYCNIIFYIIKFESIATVIYR